jgi:hypothetical protein
MIEITAFDPSFRAALPESARLLAASNLVVHPRVESITLHGSRGPSGGARPDSDFDLCLHVELDPSMPEDRLDQLLRGVIEATRLNWRGTVQVDPAAVYALRPNGLDYFEQPGGSSGLLPNSASGHFAVFKTQKGFDGFVDGDQVLLSKMLPCMVIWRRPPA